MNNYFFGRYFKFCGRDGTVALIVARHKTGGRQSASLQIITNDGAWCIPYPIEDYNALSDGFGVTLGESRFDKSGVLLNSHGDGIALSGEVRFGAFAPIHGDIMGPFRFVPFMQCRHSVYSMRHALSGSLTVNGKNYSFDGGTGYIEGDRGYSFPERYVWTHSFSDKPSETSLMLSCADIPLGPFRFTGVICVVDHRGQQYRLATYRGAKVEKCAGGELTVRCGDLRLTARLIEKRDHPLNAPQKGAMVRTIRESAACKAYFRFEKGRQTLFEFTTDDASFEFEYPE